MARKRKESAGRSSTRSRSGKFKADPEPGPSLTTPGLQENETPSIHPPESLEDKDPTDKLDDDLKDSPSLPLTTELIPSRQEDSDLPEVTENSFMLETSLAATNVREVAAESSPCATSIKLSEFNTSDQHPDILDPLQTRTCDSLDLTTKSLVLLETSVTDNEVQGVTAESTPCAISTKLSEFNASDPKVTDPVLTSTWDPSEMTTRSSIVLEVPVTNITAPLLTRTWDPSGLTTKSSVVLEAPVTEITDALLTSTWDPSKMTTGSSVVLEAPFTDITDPLLTFTCDPSEMTTRSSVVLEAPITDTTDPLLTRTCDPSDLPSKSSVVLKAPVTEITDPLLTSTWNPSEMTTGSSVVLETPVTDTTDPLLTSTCDPSEMTTRSSVELEAPVTDITDPLLTSTRDPSDLPSKSSVMLEASANDTNLQEVTAESTLCVMSIKLSAFNTSDQNPKVTDPLLTITCDPSEVISRSSVELEALVTGTTCFPVIEVAAGCTPFVTSINLSEFNTSVQNTDVTDHLLTSTCDPSNMETPVNNTDVQEVTDESVISIKLSEFNTSDQNTDVTDRLLTTTCNPSNMTFESSVALETPITNTDIQELTDESVISIKLCKFHASGQNHEVTDPLLTSASDPSNMTTGNSVVLEESVTEVNKVTDKGSPCVLSIKLSEFNTIDQNPEVTNLLKSTSDPSDITKENGHLPDPATSNMRSDWLVEETVKDNKVIPKSGDNEDASLDDTDRSAPPDVEMKDGSQKEPKSDLPQSQEVHLEEQSLHDLHGNDMTADVPETLVQLQPCKAQEDEAPSIANMSHPTEGEPWAGAQTQALATPYGIKNDHPPPEDIFSHQSEPEPSREAAELADSQLLGALEETLTQDADAAATPAPHPLVLGAAISSSRQKRPQTGTFHPALPVITTSAMTLQGQQESRTEDATCTVQGLILELSNLNRLIMSTYRDLRQKRTRLPPGRGGVGKRRRDI